MLTIKRAWDLKEKDIPYIVNPHHAFSKLREQHCSYRPPAVYHDHRYGAITESEIKDGQYVVLATTEQHYVFWRNVAGINPFLPSTLGFRIRNLLGIEREGYSLASRQKAEPEAKPDWWHEVKGAAKQVVNDALRAQAASTAAWMQEEGIAQFKDDQGTMLTAEEVAQAYRDTGQAALNILDKEQQGAAAVAAIPAYPAVLLALDAVLGRGKALIRDPKGFSKDLENALKDARSEAEALGNLGMEQAKKRLGHNNDPRYNNRYHGPDGMTQDTHGRLAEWEAKGSRNSNRSVAEDTAGHKQGSKKKNERRAKTMAKKQAKVAQPSNRQGGPYTQAEIDLWTNILNKEGNKRHISSHTNTTMGKTVVFERDVKGNISAELDRFEIENFNAAKEVIQEVFK